MNAIAPGLIADQSQISDFANALFRYAEPGTFVALRAYHDGDNQVFSNEAHQVTDDIGALVRAAVPIVNRAARSPHRVVFCPPIATFTNATKADGASFANGLALSVECDSNPAYARGKLEALLGPATVVVASGGEWPDPATGEVQDKLHLHWRLNEPTQTQHEHQTLKIARALAAALVDGDRSNIPPEHPIRWPGSWHRKGEPRPVKIVSLTDVELDLGDALELLQDAAKAAEKAAEAKPSKEAPNSPGDIGGDERDSAELIRAMLTASDYHAPQIALAMRWLKGGMADPHAVFALRGILLAIPPAERDLKDGTLQPGRWQARYDDTWRSVETARAKLGAPPEPEAKPDEMADLVNPATLQGIDPPDREWIVDGWLPVGTVTSLYGGAGFGKTLLAQQLATATALGAPFLGLPTTQCRSIAFYCEDDPDELHRRQRGICWHYGTQMQALGAMRWQARAGKPNIMATVEKGLMKFSHFFDFVGRAVQETGARLIILDNIAQLFGGNENVRPEVTQFVNAISSLALEHNAAVLLLGHPGKATDSQYSGSTAWDAAVRSRWLLDRLAPEAGDDGAGAAELADLRVLRKAKANYAGTGDEIPLRWVDGAFRVEGAASVQQVINLAEITAGINADNATFLACLDAMTEQGRNVSANKHAFNFAPKLMQGKPSAAGLSRKKLTAAMERLFDAGYIEVGTFGRGRDRKPIVGIVRKIGRPAGQRDAVAGECGEVARQPAGECGEVANQAAGECGTVQTDCGEVAGNPLISMRDGCCGEVAGECGEVAHNPLISEREGCVREYPICITYISGAPLGMAPDIQAQGEAP